MSTLIDTLSSTLTRATGRAQARLGFDPKPHYHYLISFPKSGNTWLRFLVANLLVGETPLGLTEFGRYVPDSHIKGDLPFMVDPASPFNQAPYQFVKSHRPYTREFHRVIYLARDGRDALTSLFHWSNARNRPYALRDLIVGASPFRRWSDHVMGWVNRRPQLILVKYEALYADTVGTMARLLDRIGWRLPAERLAVAVERSSFRAMRAMEQGLSQSEGAAPTREQPADNAEKPLFVRKGGSGDWRNLFSPEDEALFWEHNRAGMEALGYRT